MKERVRGGECVLITDVTCSWYPRLVIIVVVIVMVMTVMIVLGIETVYGLVIKTGCGYPSAAVHARVSSALTRHMPLQAFCGERASWRNGLLSCLLLLASRVTCRF